jgi:glycine/D-amino acid oxidase-like deaminating enzyme
VRELEPALADGLPGVWFVGHGRRVDPGALTVALATLAAMRGAVIRHHLQARACTRSATPFRGVVTDDGVLLADTVVVARGTVVSGAARAGGGAAPGVAGPRLARPGRAGQPGLVRHIIERVGWTGAGRLHDRPGVADMEAAPGADVGAALHPGDDGTITCGSSVGTGHVPRARGCVDPRPDRGDERPRRAGARRRRGPFVLVGLRPVTPDDRPVVDRAGDGLYVATGHGALGVILGSGTARLVAADVWVSRRRSIPRRSAPDVSRRRRSGTARLTRMHSTPRSDGFHMPPEFAPHQGTLMAWPARTDFWAQHLGHAKDDYAAMARAVAAFEPVTMVCPPGSAGEVRDRCGEGTEPLELPIDDSWMRDNGPIFVTNDRDEVALVQFGFNSWGEKYLPYDKDARVPELLADALGVRRYVAPMILEGGSFFVDGEGTLLTTEECLLNPNRNPDLSREQIETILRDHLGVDAIVFVAAARDGGRPRHRRAHRRRGADRATRDRDVAPAQGVRGPGRAARGREPPNCWRRRWMRAGAHWRCSRSR